LIGEHFAIGASPVHRIDPRLRVAAATDGSPVLTIGPAVVTDTRTDAA
jgi:hypothetical protein